MRRQIKSTLIIVLLVSFAIGASNFLAVPTVSASPVLDKKNSASASTFQDAMRKLWEDHITWTRLFIVSAKEVLIASIDTESQRVYSLLQA